MNNKNDDGKTIYGIAATTVVLAVIAGVSLMVISDQVRHLLQRGKK